MLLLTIPHTNPDNVGLFPLKKPYFDTVGDFVGTLGAWGADRLCVKKKAENQARGPEEPKVATVRSFQRGSGLGRGRDLIASHDPGP